MNPIVVEKQIIINQFKLPYELCDIVKDCLFYDRTSVESRRRLAIVSNLIHQASLSRRNCVGDDVEHWGFGFHDLQYGETLQLQAINCGVCGGYIQSNLNNLSQNITCNCFHITQQQTGQLFDVLDDDPVFDEIALGA